MRKKLVVGNWKMYGSRSANALLLAGLKEAGPWSAEVVVCVPFPYIAETALALTGQSMAFGAQDCSAHEAGAFTGEVSSTMLADLGCRYGIVGHSERRADHNESDATVKAKAEAARRNALIAIVCVGETRADRKAGKTLAVVRRQLKGSIPDHMTSRDLVVAYEPVWAIGTGLTPTAGDVAEVHAMIRQDLRRIVGKEEAEKVRILYGGSVKPSNAKELMSVPNVNGALVGGASLKALDLLGIVAAYA